MDRIRASVRASPTEICGVLVGGEGVIQEAWPIPNASPRPETSFLLDPGAHLRAARKAREKGYKIVGHYHSHPSGVAQPSTDDAEAAEEQGVYWLIVTAEDQRLWISRRAGAVGNAFEAVSLEVVACAALQPGREGAIGDPGRVKEP